MKGSLRLLTVDLLSRPRILLTMDPALDGAFDGAFEGGGDGPLLLLPPCLERDECSVACVCDDLAFERDER